MKNKKPTKKTKFIKKAKPIKTKKVKQKIIKIPDNQLENLNKWLVYYKEHKKFPHSRIICSNCKMDYIGLKGIGMSHAMKKFDNDINKVLTQSICKSCKELINPPPEKKERVVEVLTREEMEARRDEIRKTIPKYDPDKVRTIYDIVKDKDMCKIYTYFACHRPDIYLDYGCQECALKKHCACPIKDLNRVADGRHRKKKK